MTPRRRRTHPCCEHVWPHSLLQHRHSLGNTPGQGIGIAQMRGKVGEPALDVPDLAEFQTTFKHSDGLVEVPFAEVQQANTEARQDNATWLIDGLGDPDRLLVASDPLS